MSIFAADTTATWPIPSDPTQTVTIRKLTGRELDRAQQEHLSALVSGRPARGWASVFTRAIKDGVSTDAVVPHDPLNGFDRFTVIKSGLTGWTYPKPVTPEIIETLDDDAVEFLATEILRLTKPSLFQTVAEQEGAQKND